MKKSKYGGNKEGLGFYELMVVPRPVYMQAIDAIKSNQVDRFYGILGVQPAEKPLPTGELGRILIIEDKLDIVKAVENTLKNRGFSVTYSCGEEGLMEMERTEIDMLILDLTLPDVDVLNICRVLRSNEGTSRIPIIIINGNRQEDDIVEALNAGADDYVFEGFSFAELAARVKAVLRAYN